LAMPGTIFSVSPRHHRDDFYEEHPEIVQCGDSEFTVELRTKDSHHAIHVNPCDPVFATLRKNLGELGASGFAATSDLALQVGTCQLTEDTSSFEELGLVDGCKIFASWPDKPDPNAVLVVNSKGTKVKLRVRDTPYDIDSQWHVPPPNSDAINLAAITCGATVCASSNFWGKDMAATEKLNNVLRLGARYGSPLFDEGHGDDSFIFKDSDRNPHLIVDLGGPTMLQRVGIIYDPSDRTISKLTLETCEKEDFGDKVTTWANAVRIRPSPGHYANTFYDSKPVRARFIRVSVGNGSERLNAVFGYGSYY